MRADAFLARCMEGDRAFQDSDLCGVRANGARLRGVDLSGADLRGADFTGSNLGQADLSNSNASPSRAWHAAVVALALTLFVISSLVLFFLGRADATERFASAFHSYSALIAGLALLWLVVTLRELGAPGMAIVKRLAFGAVIGLPLGVVMSFFVPGRGVLPDLLAAMTAVLAGVIAMRLPSYEGMQFGSLEVGVVAAKRSLSMLFVITAVVTLLSVVIDDLALDVILDYLVLVCMVAVGALAFACALTLLGFYYGAVIHVGVFSGLCAVLFFVSRFDLGRYLLIMVGFAGIAGTIPIRSLYRHKSFSGWTLLLGPGIVLAVMNVNLYYHPFATTLPGPFLMSWLTLLCGTYLAMHAWEGTRLGHFLRSFALSLWPSARTRFRDAYLRGASFSGTGLLLVDMRRAHLAGADLTSRSLMGADLQQADLSGSSLREANLSWADLREANLRDADLTAASLRGADLRGAALEGANFTGADIRNADFEHASMHETKFPDAFLDGVRFPADMRHGALQGAGRNIAWALVSELLRIVLQRWPQVAGAAAGGILAWFLFKSIAWTAAGAVLGCAASLLLGALLRKRKQRASEIEAEEPPEDPFSQADLIRIATQISAGADSSEIEGQFLECIAADPEDPALRLAYATLLDMLGRNAEAVPLLVDGLRQPPYDPSLAAQLAWALVDSGGDPRQIERWLSIAWEYEPARPALADTEAWVKFLQGDYAGALAAQEPALGFASQEPCIAYHAGAIHLKLGNPAEARKYLQLALAHKRPFSGRSDASGLLEQVSG